MEINKNKIISIFDNAIKNLLFLWVLLIPISIGAMNTLSAILFILFILNILLGKKYKFFFNRIDKSILSFSLLILVSSLWAYDYFYVIDEFVRSVLSYLLMYYLILNVIKKKDIEKIFLFYWASSSVVAIFAGYEHFVLGITRASGFTHNPNRLGATMMMFIVLNFSIFLFSKNKFYRFGSSFGIIFGFLGLFSSLSRSALISTIIALFIISIIKNKKYIYIYILSMIVLFLFLPNEYKSRLIRLTDFSSHNVSQRWLMYVNGTEIFLDNFLTGIGFNNIKNVYEFYDLSMLRNSYRHFHNLFINIAVELGIFGLIGILFLVYEILRINIYLILKKSDFINIGVLGVIFAQISYNMFDTNFHAPEVVLIFIFLVSIMVLQYNLILRNNKLSGGDRS